MDLLAADESSTLEFKSSARYNVHTKQPDKTLELGVVKTVAGFMNAHGGTLLIGVNDGREVHGLEKDYATIKRRDRDGYENWLTTLLETALGKPAAANAPIRFESLDAGDVCRIDVEPGKSPVFVKLSKEDADFYVRLNNSTRLLNTSDAMEYTRAHWGRG